MEKFDKIKKHVRDNKQLYTGIGIGAGLAGLSVLIMRGVASQPINRGISVVAENGISVQGKKVVMDNVSYISANRQGPPSWVVRCIETGDIFTSQLSAAKDLDVPAAELSKHLNGKMDHVRGFTFERICMAA